MIPIAESLDNETQCGFRPGRSCNDAIFAVKIALRKRSEHDLGTWTLFLDLVKAFDRVPRELLWPILGKAGVPPKLIRLLTALHSTVNVEFAISGIKKSVTSTIGVKQGDTLGPLLFTFFIGIVSAHLLVAQFLPTITHPSPNLILFWFCSLLFCSFVFTLYSVIT